MARGGASFKVTTPSEARRAARVIVRNAARALMNDTRNGTPVDTGALRDGWRVSPASNYDSRVLNSVAYVRFVEFGTKRHPPVAMLGKALAKARAKQR